MRLPRLRLFERGSLPWARNRPLIDIIREWDGAGEPPEFHEPIDDSQLRFAAGALDGLATHHVPIERGTGGGEVERAVDAFARLVKIDSDQTRRSFYDELVTRLEPDQIDQFLERIASSDLPRDTARARARWLMGVASHPAALKVAIALIGATGKPDDVQDLITIARHDEFALYSAVAAENLLPDPVDVLWHMARGVRGWGKIQLVERLAAKVGTRDDIKSWLVRDGFANSIMDEYLALTCARVGDLAAALSPSSIDPEMLDSACRLVKALYDEGPAAGISEYADGVTVVQRLLGHVDRDGSSLEHLAWLVSTLDWIDWPTNRSSELATLMKESEREVEDEIQEDWARRESLGWTALVRADIANRCRSIVRQPRWPAVVRASISREAQARWAFALSEDVGLDLWNEAFAILERDPLDDAWYHWLLRTRQPARIALVLELAERHLPLASIASGPDRLLGLGAEFKAHSCLDFLVQEMTRPEVWSPRLVATALRSPVVRNRNMAIKALGAHPRAEWDEALDAVVRQTLEDETEPDVRAFLESTVGAKSRADN